ncbi:hypothetical protein CDAR_497781 [Caerostris darwini]|uniref:Uncharacterized protein n=1 Tax=Caerostris darwini TaxID=1538125 RepID=A0AAV4PQ52_9ARAC|nr:hypothetical protein CDAR_497781 [Caerostris darwini]
MRHGKWIKSVSARGSFSTPSPLHPPPFVEKAEHRVLEGLFSKATAIDVNYLMSSGRRSVFEQVVEGVPNLGARSLRTSSSATYFHFGDKTHDGL